MAFLQHIGNHADAIDHVSSLGMELMELIVQREPPYYFVANSQRCECIVDCMR